MDINNPKNKGRTDALFCLVIALESVGILHTLTQEERMTMLNQTFPEWPKDLQEKLRPYGAEMVRDSPPQT